MQLIWIIFTLNLSGIFADNIPLDPLISKVLPFISNLTTEDKAEIASLQSFLKYQTKSDTLNVVDVPNEVADAPKLIQATINAIQAIVSSFNTVVDALQGYAVNSQSQSGTELVLPAAFLNPYLNFYFESAQPAVAELITVFQQLSQSISVIIPYIENGYLSITGEMYIPTYIVNQILGDFKQFLSIISSVGTELSAAVKQASAVEDPGASFKTSTVIKLVNKYAKSLAVILEGIDVSSSQLQFPIEPDGSFDLTNVELICKDLNVVLNKFIVTLQGALGALQNIESIAKILRSPFGNALFRFV